jgi:hypothetical protein
MSLDWKECGGDSLYAASVCVHGASSALIGLHLMLAIGDAMAGCDEERRVEASTSGRMREATPSAGSANDGARAVAVCATWQDGSQDGMPSLWSWGQFAVKVWEALRCTEVMLAGRCG